MSVSSPWLRAQVFLQLLLLLLLLLLSSWTNGHNAIVKYLDNRIVEENGIITKRMNNTRFFLLTNGIAREIEHLQTLDQFGLDSSKHHHIKSISRTMLMAFQFGDPVPLMKQADRTADEILRLELMRNLAIQNQLTIKTTLVAENCKNPAIYKWNGHMLFCGTHESKGIQLTLRWINTSYAPFSKNEEKLDNTWGSDTERSFMGISVDNYQLPPGRPLYGIDARLCADAPDRLWIAYSRCCGQDLTMKQMIVSLAEYRVVDGVLNNMYSKEITPDPQGFDPQGKHKNWGPFIYEEQLHFVQQINPLVVVTLPELNDDDTPDSFYSNDAQNFVAKTVSIAPAIDIEGGKHNDLRGGSQPILIDQGVQGWLNAHTMEWEAVDRGKFYLAFYHQIILDPTGYKSYYMGAYTFSATAPFRLISISPVPILNYPMYDGEWLLVRGLPYAYSNYVTSFHIEDTQPDDPSAGPDTKIVHVHHGHQDRLVYDQEINLKDLFDSLMLV